MEHRVRQGVKTPETETAGGERACVCEEERQGSRGGWCQDSVTEQELCRRLHIPGFRRQRHYYCILGRKTKPIQKSFCFILQQYNAQKGRIHAEGDLLFQSPWHRVCLFCVCTPDWRRERLHRHETRASPSV